MAEWSIAAVLKTVEGHTSGGSNPSLSANNLSKIAVAYKAAAIFIFIPYKNTYNIGSIDFWRIVKNLCLGI